LLVNTFGPSILPNTFNPYHKNSDLVQPISLLREVHELESEGTARHAGIQMIYKAGVEGALSRSLTGKPT